MQFISEYANSVSNKYCFNSGIRNKVLRNTCLMLSLTMIPTTAGSIIETSTNTNSFQK